jgi:hypothetical protein
MKLLKTSQPTASGLTGGTTAFLNSFTLNWKILA